MPQSLWSRRRSASSTRSLTTIRAHETGPDGRPNPTYRCLFPSPPPPGAIPTCAEAGVLGALAGVLGSLMAMEVIREIVGFGESLVGRLLMIDARSMRFDTIRYGWDEENPLSGSGHPGLTADAGRDDLVMPSRAAPRPSSLPPRRRSWRETASISTSVRVFSVGWRVTAIATDFLSGSMPAPS